MAEIQDTRLFQLESKTEKIENKISDIYLTLNSIAETLKELKNMQLNQIKTESEIKNLKNEINILKKDIEGSFNDLDKIKEKGTDVCHTHQIELKEINSIYKSQYEFIKQSINELKEIYKEIEQKIKERDKLFLGLIFTIIAQVVWGVIKTI